MSDNPEQTTATPSWHDWTFQANASAPEQLFSFGMPLSEIDATNRICAQLGVESLAEGAKVYHKERTQEQEDAVTRSQAIYSPDAENYGYKAGTDLIIGPDDEVTEETTPTPTPTETETPPETPTEP